jgi:hypothetical protein
MRRMDRGWPLSGQMDGERIDGGWIDRYIVGNRQIGSSR